MSGRWKQWAAVGAMAGALYGFGNLYRPVVVVGESMAPTLPNGRLVWVDQTYYRRHRPQRGEIVVFRLQGETYIKRVYRGPGETLTYLASNGEWLGPVREQRAENLRRRFADRRRRLEVRQLRVPEDCVFVLGDNYFYSEDSRELGPIPIRCLLGRVHAPIDNTVALQYEIAPRFVRSRPQPHAAAPRPSEKRQMPVL